MGDHSIDLTQVSISIPRVISLRVEFELPMLEARVRVTDYAYKCHYSFEYFFLIFVLEGWGWKELWGYGLETM